MEKHFFLLNLMQHLFLAGNLCIAVLLFSILSQAVRHQTMMSLVMILLHLLTLICM